MITKYYTVITKYNLYMDSFPPVVLLDRFSRVNRQTAGPHVGSCIYWLGMGRKTTAPCNVARRGCMGSSGIFMFFLVF